MSRKKTGHMILEIFVFGLFQLKLCSLFPSILLKFQNFFFMAVEYLFVCIMHFICQDTCYLAPNIFLYLSCSELFCNKHGLQASCWYDVISLGYITEVKFLNFVIRSKFVTELVLCICCSDLLFSPMVSGSCFSSLSSTALVDPCVFKVIFGAF